MIFVIQSTKIKKRVDSFTTVLYNKRMNILIIDDHYSTQYKNKYESGVHKVSRSLAQILSAIHNVTFYTYGGGDHITDESFKHVQSSLLPAYYYEEGEKPKNYNQISYEEIEQLIEANNFDLIISNAYRNAYILKKQKDWKVPNFVIVHGNAIGGLMDINLAKLYHDVNAIAVSQYCYDHWHTRFAKAKPEFMPVLAGYFCFQYEKEQPTILPASDYVQIIGRCDGLKKPHIGIEATLLTKNNCKAFLTRQEFYDKGNEYYNKRIAKFGDNERVELNFSRPYNEVMESLRSARFLISTWTDESSGIVALEAAIRGIPVILNTKNDKHASEILLTSYKKVNNTKTRGNKLFKEIADIINHSNDDAAILQARQAISDDAWKKFKPSAFMTRFDPFLKRIINNFNK